MNRNLGPGGANQRELTVKFKVIKFLGKGSFGSVFQVQRLGDGQTYALKELDVRSMSQAEREDAVNEIRLLASVQHPNVVGYHEAFLDGNRLCIIMEYAPDGDMLKLINKWKMMRRPMPEDLIWKLLIQVVRGLAALHNMKILHRDIKPANIMVMAGDIAKIGDLGIAKLLTSTLAAKTQIGTPHYMPPEIWKSRPYSFSSDSWAVGCLLYELMTYSVPFEARSMQELRYKILRGAYPPVPNIYSKDLANLVRDCLDMVPEKRPTMERILANPAVSSRMHLLNEGRGGPPPTAASVIDTIKVPRGNFAAIKGKLPPANYASDMKDIVGAGKFRPIAEEGQEGRAEVLEVNKLPAVPAGYKPQLVGGPVHAPPALQPKSPPGPPQYGQAPAPRLPPMPSRPAYGAPPPIAAPRAPAPPVQPYPSVVAPSHAGSRWPAGARVPGIGGPMQQISESHAAYGAFYHHPPKHAAPARPVPVYGGAALPQRPQWNNVPPGPAYPNPYQANRQPPGVGGMPRLPAIPQAGGVRPAPAPPVGALSKAPPPWNYGVGAGARAAAAAYAAGLRAQQARTPPGVAPPAPERYPPPQWQPRPVRV